MLFEKVFLLPLVTLIGSLVSLHVHSHNWLCLALWKYKYLQNTSNNGWAVVWSDWSTFISNYAKKTNLWGRWYQVPERIWRYVEWRSIAHFQLQEGLRVLWVNSRDLRNCQRLSDSRAVINWIYKYRNCSVSHFHAFWHFKSKAKQICPRSFLRRTRDIFSPVYHSRMLLPPNNQCSLCKFQSSSHPAPFLLVNIKICFNPKLKAAKNLIRKNLLVEKS